MTGLLRRRWRTILVAALAAFATGAVGGLMTDIGPWYAALRKPPWQPPDWLFGPVWTTIFALAAVSGVKSWARARGTGGRPIIACLFALNAIANVGWTYLFFTAKRPDWALWEVGLLWATVLALIFVTGRYSRTAGWLLVPYLLWVSFAAFLNWEIVRLNAPFG